MKKQRFFMPSSLTSPSTAEQLCWENYSWVNCWAFQRLKNLDSQKSVFTFSVKEMYDYQGRSYLHVPQDVGVNLRSTVPPEKCYLPKKQIHVWSGHTKVGMFVSIQCDSPFNFLSEASNFFETEESVEEDFPLYHTLHVISWITCSHKVFACSVAVV